MMRLPTRTMRRLAAALAFATLPVLGNVLNPNVIDFVVVERDDGEVFMDIVQHLPWTRETMNLLDRKVDGYVSYFAQGQIARNYPQFAGRPVVIRVVYVQTPDPAALWRLEAIKTRIAPRGIGMTWVPLTPPAAVPGG
jgi:hypothetical protein